MSTPDDSTTATSHTTKPVDLANRDELVDLLDNNSPVLLEFYTKGCTLCQSIEPVLGTVARATGITVGMVNPQVDLDLVEEYDIKSVPTLVVIEDGHEVGRLAEGFQGADAIISFLAATLDDEHLKELVDSN